MENQRKLTKEMLVLQTTPQGRRYYELRRDALLSTKNHQGGLNDPTDESDGKMFEVINSLCPVKTIENFLKHLNPKLDCLFQRPRELSAKFNPEKESVWYCNSPVGESTLANMMKTMSTAAGISPHLTNHCVRATTVTVYLIVMWRQDTLRQSRATSQTVPLNPTALEHLGQSTVDTLSLNGKEIRTAEELQLLGVTIDSQMDFNNHISALCKRASQKIGVLMRLRNLIPTTAKLHLFKAAILPHLTYCHLAWHFCKESDTRKLERLQERGLRAVFKDNNLSYVNLLKRAKLPTLLNRRLQDLCILMYKVKHELCPSYIRNIFSRQSNTYNLRQSDFTLPRFKTVTHGKHSVRFLGPKLWSKLPKNNRDAESLNVFKKRIRDLNLSELIDDG